MQCSWKWNSDWTGRWCHLAVQLCDPVRLLDQPGPWRVPSLRRILAPAFQRRFEVLLLQRGHWIDPLHLIIYHCDPQLRLDAILLVVFPWPLLQSKPLQVDRWRSRSDNLGRWRHVSLQQLACAGYHVISGRLVCRLHELLYLQLYVCVKTPRLKTRMLCYRGWVRKEQVSFLSQNSIISKYYSLKK